MDRLAAVEQLYEYLEQLANRGGVHPFSTLESTDVPRFGVYFFFESGESRTDSGTGPRVVRVGTHAITETSKTSVWSRLKQHRGNEKRPGGNHRGSIFRLLVGDAMQQRDAGQLTSWGVGKTASHDVRRAELGLEDSVSRYIREMRVVVADVPNRGDRETLESSAIALLSNYGKAPIDAASAAWLGQYSTRDRVRGSSLWNSRGVDWSFDPKALEIFG